MGQGSTVAAQNGDHASADMHAKDRSVSPFAAVVMHLSAIATAITRKYCHESGPCDDWKPQQPGSCGANLKAHLLGDEVLRQAHKVHNTRVGAPRTGHYGIQPARQHTTGSVSQRLCAGTGSWQ